MVSLGGLGIGWLAYRNVTSPEQDKLQIPLLKNKYYFDELYNFLFVKPAYWFAETFVYQWVDKGLIDGTLHLFGKAANVIGLALRKYIDVLVINQTMGDGTAACHTMGWP